jgi:altered-inheritance-of-mitochondria protein 5
MDVLVKPKLLNKVRGHPVWEGCARIPTNHTSTPVPPTNSLKQGLTVLAAESNHHGLHIWPRK